MKIFVSWSGSASLEVAQAFKEWLPNVIQAISEDQIFLSSEDIDKGARWFNALGQVLDDADFGILCLTENNRNRPWILYEAGAISKRLGESSVVPLLIGLTPDKLDDPLRQFNAAQLSKKDFKRLLIAINNKLGDERLSEKQLNGAFNNGWPQLEPRLRTAVATSFEQDYVYDVFLSAPMAAFANDAEYQASRTQIKKVFDALKKDGTRVYWAAENVLSIDDFDTMDVSVTDDLSALARSRCFILVYPEKLVTSALFEAGYALARNAMSHYFVRNRDDLPFLMRELAGPIQNVRIHTHLDWKDYDDLAHKVRRNKRNWFQVERSSKP